MFEMEIWEWMLLGGAGYVALTALVRLMRRRRDEVLHELSLQAEAERPKTTEKNRGESRKVADKSNRKAS